MEYHSERFEDMSLLIFNEEKLVALLPANKTETILHSHQGLTYGGLILTEKLKLNETIEIFKAILLFLETQRFETLNIKLLPSIYSNLPSKEIDYILFLLNAEVTRRDVLSVIDYRAFPQSISTIRKRGVKKAKEHQLIIKENNDFEAFWNQVLIPNLEKRYKKQPVHTLLEIQRLHKHFPEKIRQFNVYKDDKIVGGTTIFETKTVAHAQYISATENKQELGSLDFLFNELTREIFKHKAFFDFGISNENNGKKLNEGLLYWKESFGARTVTQDFYRLTVKNHKLLNTVML
ncbi:GNAT family N-acetyltransferase [uncultured Lacinutrix sp.]|uniref:GNAT family N-acetyltransferase n=1 Tax=uncultured Lacinutrix sp. TaxID=574032 RepID=UPI0026152B41|nr:GNAT family N-acetyltransferase [uncultured Lacinutrix sp.]